MLPQEGSFVGSWMGHRSTKVCYYNFSLCYPKGAHSLGHGWGNAPRKYAITIFHCATPRELILWVSVGALDHESRLFQFFNVLLQGGSFVGNYLHFASSTFITYSPNLSPFLWTISHHLACQDVFPMAGKTVTLSETGADYNGCRLCSDTGEFMLHFRQILNSFYLTEITDTLYCYHTEFTDTTIYGFLLGHYIYHSWGH